MNDVPGYRIVDILGVVYGQTTMSSSLGSSFSAGFKSLAGGEISQYTKRMNDARDIAVERMVSQCLAKGGNAIIAMRFDVGSMGDVWSQACAYGTACIIEKE
jgi:uncharacterized protein YbjQ (UPF0145 family)